MSRLVCLVTGHPSLLRWSDAAGTTVMCCRCLTVRTNRRAPARAGRHR